VFVAILPFSGLIFCKAVPTQRTADFIACINDMLRFYGGVPKTILNDNLKTAVTRPCKYEPVFTEMCNQLSEHYQTTFSATRPYSPRDKAMVERAVNIVYSHIYAPLRNSIFFSLEELQLAMQAPLIKLNDKPYKNTSYSRQYFYEQYERTLLKVMSHENFTQKKVSMATVQCNYHIQLSENHLYYSAPFTYVGKKVKLLYDNRTVEVYYNHKRIALHVRKSTAKSYTTQPEHMPANHLHMYKVKGWTKEDLLLQAEKIGCYTLQVAAHILDNSIYKEQNYKACYGMLMLEKKYNNRLEVACKGVANNGRINYTIVKNILKNGLDKQAILFDNTPIPAHDNIHGAGQYQ